VAWDLETTDLKALMGRVLCCSFMEITPPGTALRRPYTFRGDRAPWMNVPTSKWHEDPEAISDAKLVVAIRDELERYNMIVSWNGKLFDAAFLNARLLKIRERPLRPQFHLDSMWYAAGSSNRIGSRKLDNVQRFLGLSESKTPITWEDWQRAGMGNMKAFNQVVKHCEQDVKVLAQAYWRFLPNVSSIHR